MHREIQIKQFPIVTTHWWPKTRNERFVWENEQYLYRFFTSCTQPCPSDLSAHTHPVCDVCVRALWLTLHSHGVSRQRLTDGVSEAWCWRAVIVTTTNHILLWCCMNGIGYLHEADWLTPPLALEKLRQHHASDTPSVKRWCRRPVWMQREPERAHTGCVCALRSLGHGCVQEVKNDINTVRFLTQTACFVS